MHLAIYIYMYMDVNVYAYNQVKTCFTCTVTNVPDGMMPNKLTQTISDKTTITRSWPRCLPWLKVRWGSYRGFSNKCPSGVSEGTFVFGDWPPLTFNLRDPLIDALVFGENILLPANLFFVVPLTYDFIHHFSIVLLNAEPYVGSTNLTHFHIGGALGSNPCIGLRPFHRGFPLSNHIQ